MDRTFVRAKMSSLYTVGSTILNIGASSNGGHKAKGQGILPCAVGTATGYETL